MARRAGWALPASAVATSCLIVLLGFAATATVGLLPSGETVRASPADHPGAAPAASVALAYGPPALEYPLHPHAFGPSYRAVPFGGSTAPSAPPPPGGYVPMKHCSWMPRLWKLSAG